MASKRFMFSAILLTVAAVGQIVLAFLCYNPDGSAVLINLGWGVMFLSALFGWLPILTFRRKGKVEGRSYMHTTMLVDSGVYAIVRHPQYLAGVLMAIALTMISLHWLVAAFGLAAIAIYVRDTYAEEERCIQKFGATYQAYMQRVPRLNFIRGILRLIFRRDSG